MIDENRKSRSSTKVLRYVSYFSGIGAPEHALQILTNDTAKCLAFCEINQEALRVYSKNFSLHAHTPESNLGDITSVPLSKIRAIAKKGVDLVIAGFPCKQVSGLANLRSRRNGIDGKQSGLIRPLVEHIRVYLRFNPQMKIVLENTTMPDAIKQDILKLLASELRQDFRVCVLDSHEHFGCLQRRRRTFFTNFDIRPPSIADAPNETWDSILEHISKVQRYHVSEKCIRNMNKIIQKYPSKDNLATVAYPDPQKTHRHRDRWMITQMPSTRRTRWSHIAQYGDTSRTYATPLTTSSNSTLLLDRRQSPDGIRNILIRRYTVREICRLFSFPDQWIPSDTSIYAAMRLMGNSIHVQCIQYILSHVA
jgi:site-specific DNA-cytosine methylase